MREPLRVLILGGTIEGRELAERLASDARFRTVVSLAGRTEEPAALPSPVRVGGFGGEAGLCAYLADHRVDIVIDATHPFAATIKTNALSACTTLGLPLLAIERDPWQREPGDRWTIVEDVRQALIVIGETPRCVFVTIGRQGLAALESAPQHIYLVRSIDPPVPPPNLPNVHYIAARGPFHYAGEMELMRNYGVEWLVTKHSGGASTYAKIEAGRRLNIPVAMITRPLALPRDTVATAAGALLWLDRRHQAHSGTS